MTVFILIAIALMMVCGIGLVVAGLRSRADRLALRIQLVKPKTVGREAEARVSENLRQTKAIGFNEGEYRQIIVLFAKLGVPAHLAERYFTAFRLVLALSLAFTSMLWIPSEIEFVLQASVFVFVAIVIWFIPKWFVSRKANQYKRAVGHGLADALELLAICMEAGIALEGGLERVSKELKSSHPALAEELGRTWAEISILPDREQALSNFAVRINIPSVRSVVSMLVQSFRYGTPLVNGLRIAAAEIRSDQITNLEEKANRLPALMTVPVMVFIMPTIFLIVGGPAVIRILAIFAAG
jgi:tight adherence protein C